MFADHAQLIGVLLILAGAVGYLTLYFRRMAKGGGGCGCGCDAALKREHARDASGQPLIPVENLAELAARRSQERADHPTSAGNSAPEKES